MNVIKSKLNNIESFIFYIIPVVLFFDILYYFFPIRTLIVSSPMAVVKATILYVYIFYMYILKKNKIKIKNKYITLFLVYILCILPFSSNLNISVKLTMQIMASLLMFPIAASLIKTIDDLKKLNKSLIIFMLFLVLNFIISNYFKLGISEYTKGEDFLSGGLDDSWNNFTFAILLTPILIQISNKRKSRFLIFILSIVLIIILVLSLKRIAILGLLIGFCIYIIYSKFNIKYISRIFSIILIVLITFPLYGDLLLYRLEARMDTGRFESDFYESEGRYLESIYVLEKVFSFDNPIKSVFGLEAFNSIGNYLGGLYGKRQLHVDYNLVLYTTGLIGLLIYFLIYFNIYKKFKRIVIPKRKIYLEMKAVFYSLFFTSLFTSLGGQMYHITFRLMLFTYLGAIVGVLYNSKNVVINSKPAKKLLYNHIEK